MNTIFPKHTLPNGVRLLIIPTKGVNSIATSVMVGVGSRYEDPNINGISHFLEHMVFKGTKKYPTTDDVNIVEKQGGIQNAYTDVDITNYHNKVLSEDWELGLEVCKELALYPLLEDKHVDLERSVIIEEMKRYEDEPAAKVEETFHEMLYPGTKLGMRIIGTEASLLASKGLALRSYHREWYTADRIVVVLAGNIQKSQELRVKSQVVSWFGGLPSAPSRDFDRVRISQDKPRMNIVMKLQAQQAHLELGVRTFARGASDRYAWNVFNILMGVSFTSRLFREIREKRGLCYHIRSSSNNWAETGYWSIYAGVATDKVGEAVKAIVEELGKAKERGVTDEEVVISKKRIRTLLAFKSEDPEFINEYYGRQEIFDAPLLTLNEYLRRIEAVTKEDIDRLLKKYFVANTLNLALVWNKPTDDKLLKLLDF